jgi:site-specific DNA recombinase
MRAAIYVRQSLDKSGEALAVTRQLAECRDLVKRNGWTEAEVYSDNDTSATSRKPRPEWTRLLADLDAGRHDVLVCWHTDRLYRRLRDLVDLVEIAERRALRIASVRASDIDLSTPAGRMLAGMLGSAARYEVEQKGARQVAANRARAQRGISLWTRRPFGFDREGQDVRVVEAEAAELRKAAEALLSGSTLTSVVVDLNARGITTSLGKPWNVTGIRRALLNPRVAGRVEYRGEDMGRGSWPAILDPETFDRLTALLSDPRRRTAPSTKVKYLLSGLVRCGRCDVPMFATTATGKYTGRYVVYRCRTCKRTRRHEQVDQLVESVMIGRLRRPDAAALLAPDVDLGALRERAVELRDRRDGLAALLADGLLSAEAVRKQAKRLQGDLLAVERQMESAAGSSPLAVVVGADDVAAAWGRLTLPQQRDVIDVLAVVTILAAGRGARFDPEQLRIEWRGQA